MRAIILALAAITAFSGCVGPGHHMRGGHHGGYRSHGGGHHHRRSTGDVVDGIFGILQGVIAVGEIISDISESSSPSPPPPPPPPPPHPEPVRALPAYFQGRIVWQGKPGTLRLLRVGIRPLVGGTLLATVETDAYGRFSFPTPAAGSYVAFVREPGYQGETTFATNGRIGFPIEIPVSVVDAPPSEPSPDAGAETAEGSP